MLDLFEGVDPDVLAAFAAEGHEEHLAPGEPLFTEGTVPERFSVIASGEIESSRRINGVNAILSQRAGPTYVGAANALTGDALLASGRATTEVRLLSWDVPTFRAFLRDAPSAMKTAMRLIAPIAQAADALVRQQEKLAALGTLSAGLAHELNNPAAAARRTATELGEALATLQDTIHHFVSSGVEREDAARLVALQQAALQRAGEGDGSVASADREDRLAVLLDDMGQEGWRLAEPLARACLDADWLEQVQTAAGPATGPALEWVAASLTAHTLVGELHESTGRISELVAAIKDYTHMGRAAVEDVDVHDGIDSTLTMLKFRIKHEPVKVERHYDRTLPHVTVHGSELNQVWTNLLTNALDALRRQGRGHDHDHDPGARRRCRGRDRRRRAGDPRRRAVAHLRALLHHQAGRRGHRTRPRRRPPDRDRPSRRDRGALAARRHGLLRHHPGGRRDAQLMFRNDMPRYEILSEEAMAVIESGWRRLLSDIGIEFLHDESLERFRAAGQTVEGAVVALRPRLRARAGREGAPGVRPASPATPRAAVRVGGDTWSSPRRRGRRSCARATTGARRRMDDFERLRAA